MSKPQDVIPFADLGELQASLTNPTTYAAVLATVRAAVEAHVPDLSSEKGRRAINSLALKVSRTKVVIDEYGKALNEEARRSINAVDEVRRKVRDEFDALRDQVKKPLADWEANEERIAREASALIRFLANAHLLSPGDTSATVRERLAKVELVELDPALLRAHMDDAAALKDKAIAALKQAVSDLEQREREQAELEQLRAQQAEAARIVRENNERLAREAEAEARRVADEKRLAELTAEAEARAEKAMEEKRRAAMLAAPAPPAEEERAGVEPARASPSATQVQSTHTGVFGGMPVARHQRAAARDRIVRALMSECALPEAAATEVFLAIAEGRIPPLSLAFAEQRGFAA